MQDRDPRPTPCQHTSLHGNVSTTIEYGWADQRATRFHQRCLISHGKRQSAHADARLSVAALPPARGAASARVAHPGMEATRSRIMYPKDTPSQTRWVGLFCLPYRVSHRTSLPTLRRKRGRRRRHRVYSGASALRALVVVALASVVDQRALSAPVAARRRVAAWLPFERRAWGGF